MTKPREEIVDAPLCLEMNGVRITPRVKRIHRGGSVYIEDAPPRIERLVPKRAWWKRWLGLGG